jgi:hypothetical protein
MKLFGSLPRMLPRFSLPLCALVLSNPVWSQTAPAAATPAELAKYDANKNGRIDPDEAATMRADAAASVAFADGD